MGLEHNMLPFPRRPSISRLYLVVYSLSRKRPITIKKLDESLQSLYIWQRLFFRLKKKHNINGNQEITQSQRRYSDFKQTWLAAEFSGIGGITKCFPSVFVAPGLPITRPIRIWWWGSPIGSMATRSNELNNKWPTTKWQTCIQSYRSHRKLGYVVQVCPK